MTVMEVAGRLGVTPYDVFIFIRAGELPAHRMGDHWRVWESDLEKFRKEWKR